MQNESSCSSRYHVQSRDPNCYPDRGESPTRESNIYACASKDETYHLHLDAHDNVAHISLYCVHWLTSSWSCRPRRGFGRHDIGADTCNGNYSKWSLNSAQRRRSRASFIYVVGSTRVGLLPFSLPSVIPSYPPEQLSRRFGR